MSASRHVAVLLPFQSFKVDEQAYRRYARYFANDPRFVRDVGALHQSGSRRNFLYGTRRETSR